MKSTLASINCKSVFLLLLAPIIHCQSWNRFWDANPVISAVSPASNTSVRSTKVSYTFSESCSSASITWTMTGGMTDPDSPHVKALVGAELTSGAHASILLTNNPSLKDSSTYSITFACTGASGAEATPVTSSNVAYIPATASRVYGQFGSFTCNVSDNTGSCVSGGALKSANGLNQPNAIAFDAGGAYIVDKGNNRVLYFPNGSTTATRVYGQHGDLTCGVASRSSGSCVGGAISADTLNLPTGVATDATGVYIADPGNNRVLYYPGSSTTATRVYGQNNSMGTGVSNLGGMPGCNTNCLANPQGVATDAAGVYIADYNNSRVLYFTGVATTTATRIYGQYNDTNCATANRASGSCTPGTITADTLSAPYRLFHDGANLFIADANNNRVLFYPGTSTTATRVYGQGGNFTTGTPNNGGITANSMSNPSGIAIDALGVYIADLSNHRALFYPGTSTTASRVYGQQGSFTTGTANNGGLSAQTLNQPIWVSTDSEGVYIMDASNHRGLFY